MVHRCGRTARNGKEGKSVILADASDKQRLVKYNKDLDQNKVKRITVARSLLDEIRPLVAEVMKLEKEEYKLNLSKKDKSWAKKMAEAAGIVLDDESKQTLSDRRQKSENIRMKKRQLKKVRQNS